MNDKKGLSTVVTTLIIILLVLVAIGLIWVVIRTAIEGGADEIDLGTKCLSVDVRATSVGCWDSGSGFLCNVSLSKKRGSEEIGGVKVIFHNTTAEETSQTLDSEDYQVTNINLLATEKMNGVVTGLTTQPDEVDVFVYFVDSKGEKFICSQPNPFSF